ncbi:hypothetical protein Tco_0871985 [Tanacetum coccineum]
MLIYSPYKCRNYFSNGCSFIPQSLPSFTHPPQQSTLTPPPTTEATNPLSTLLNFASVFQFNNRVIALENEVAKLKKGDPLNSQVTALVDKHLDSRLGATRDKFMNYLSASITAMITEQVNIQLPQILPKEVSNFAPPEIKRMVTESLEHAVLANEECYDGLIKSYDLDKSLFSTYDKVYSLKRSQKDKDKDEDPSAGSDRGLKNMKTSKDAEPTKDQQENLGSDDEEPKRKVASKRDWFTKPKQHEDPINPDWNIGKTPQQGPTQSWLMTLASSADKLLIQLLKGTRTNYTELEYDFEECYKAFSKKLDYDNPKGGDYPFDLTKPLPLVMNRNRQMVLVDYFFNNDLKYLQRGISTMTYATSIAKTKAAQYDLPGIEDMTFYGYARGLESTHDVYSTKHILAVTRVNVMRKHGYGYLREIEVRRADNDLYTFKEGHFPRLRINDIKDMLILIVQNKFTNISGDDVSDFAITLRMFTRSMVI